MKFQTSKEIWLIISAVKWLIAINCIQNDAKNKT